MKNASKVMEIIAKDEHAKGLLSALNNIAQIENMDEETYEKAREKVILFAVANNPEARKLFAGELYEDLRSAN